MEQGHIKHEDGMMFFKKQLRFSKLHNLKMLRDVQDAKINKIMHNYDQRSIIYHLRECLSRYEKSL